MTLLEQLKEMERRCECEHGRGCMRRCVGRLDVLRLTAKLREVVEAMTRLDAFAWKFVHDHGRDESEYRAWESVHYPVEHALVPMVGCQAMAFATPPPAGAGGSHE